MYLRRMALAITAASLLALSVAAPALAGATVDRSHHEVVNECQDHWDEDPESGESYFTRLCITGEWSFTSINTPGGVTLHSGSVSTSSSQYFRGEVLLDEQSQTHRFRHVTRQGLVQVMSESLTVSGVNHMSGTTYECYLRFHEANGELRFGEPALICDHEGDGGGQG